jgi:hypothetical protein
MPDPTSRLDVTLLVTCSRSAALLEQLAAGGAASLPQTVQLGRFPQSVQLTGRQLRVGPDGAVLGRVDDGGRWHLDGHEPPFSEVVVAAAPPEIPPTGSLVVDALLTVLTDRGHPPALLIQRLGRIDHDHLWERYVGPAADELAELLGLPADPCEALP